MYRIFAIYSTYLFVQFRLPLPHYAWPGPLYGGHTHRRFVCSTIRAHFSYCSVCTPAHWPKGAGTKRSPLHFAGTVVGYIIWSSVRCLSKHAIFHWIETQFRCSGIWVRWWRICWWYICHVMRARPTCQHIGGARKNMLERNGARTHTHPHPTHVGIFW